MTPRTGDETKERGDDRTRSPPRSAGAKEVKEDIKSQEVDTEGKAEEEEKAGKRRGEEGSSSSQWTWEEWEQWRKEQEDWKKRNEDRHFKNEKKWEDQQAKSSGDIQKFAHDSWEAHTATNAKVNVVAREVERQGEQVNELRAVTTQLAQWQKDDQRELANKQVKMTGWAGEHRGARRAVIERWLTAANAWHHFDHIRSLPGRGEHGLMPFSLVTCRSQDDRDAVMSMMWSFPVKGHHGNTLTARKNIAKYMREGGHRMRFMMSVLEEVSSTRFGKEWPLDAVKVGEEWVGAIIKETGRKFYIAVNKDYYDVDAAASAARRLWPAWNGYGSRHGVDSSSSTSLSSGLTSGDTRIYFLQDHADYEVVEMQEGLKASLDAALEEKEEEAEARALRNRGASRTPQRRQAEQHPNAMEGVQEEEEEDPPPPPLPPTPTAPPPGVKETLQPPAAPAATHPMDADDSSDGDEVEVTSAEARAVANHRLAKFERGEREDGGKDGGKGGTSARAVQQAKRAVNWMDEEAAGEQRAMEGEHDYYKDNKGQRKPYNSGAYYANQKGFDGEEASKGTKGWKGSGGGHSREIGKGKKHKQTQYYQEQQQQQYWAPKQRKGKPTYDYYGTPHYETWNDRNNRFESEWEGPYGDMGNAHW